MYEMFVIKEKLNNKIIYECGDIMNEIIDELEKCCENVCLGGG